MSGKNIFGALTVAAVMFFFWPAVVGTWQQVSALRASVAEREDLLARRQQILADLSKAYAEYTTKLSQQDGQKFVALVPVRKDQAELLSAMQEIAASSGVSLGEVRVTEGSTKETAQFRTLSMGMDMGGSYSSLRTFLSSLESYVRLLNVQTIEVSEDPRSPGRLKFAVKAEAYFLK